MTQPNPFRYFKTSPEIIRLAVMLYARFPLSLRNVEDLLHERGIEVSHETIRYWWNRFGPMFAAEIRRRRIQSLRSSRWQWHLDEVFVKINGKTHYRCARSTTRARGLVRRTSRGRVEMRSIGESPGAPLRFEPSDDGPVSSPERGRAEADGHQRLI
ncbi:hypothetical protein GCM10011392_39620 [Wenxinia marina]|nr:hypothetical protein GCM10011392_39620 [Wenxinia marina]